MTSTLPAIIAKLPRPTALDVSSMRRQERFEHRKAISLIVKTHLREYFDPKQSDEERAASLALWCDELEHWQADSVQAALREWIRENPSRRPNFGHIVALLRDGWGRLNAEAVRAAMAPAPEPKREKISDDRRKAILAQYGLPDVKLPESHEESHSAGPDGRHRRMVSAAQAARHAAE